ncbi:CheY-P-specific phosphatase CheC [Halobacillus litoralis]|uniref:CheY-P-specific phosphatase CheC n=1 Tax=Halobacillus litoralis TaxID=45668 RepID=A0A845E1V6_9BACI|nr:chemotaxis protein CheC [Halobacillus litoralis]MYL48673.1 CheY-P-specific phosphatase CheC [Halobacillus litoralis]
MSNPKNFTEGFGPVHLDVLKEIGNIGSGHAATSLSKLLHKKIEMHVPGVEVVDFDQVMDLAGGADKEVVSIFQRMEGDAPGTMFFIMAPSQAHQFVERMTNASEGFRDDAEMALSALQELGNILSGTYLTALSDFTELDLQSTVPSVSQDMVGAILSMGLIELSQVSDAAIVIKTSLTDGEGGGNDFLEGHFFLFPDPPSYQKIFSSLGVRADD